MSARISAAMLFLVGMLAVAAPLVMRQGWIMDTLGIVFGTATGVCAGIMWAGGGACRVPPKPPA